MQDFIDKKIIIGVCGGIAAYKTALLIRDLQRDGAQVRVVMTASAKQFVTPMTFQALTGFDVRSELFDSQAEAAMGHIELARWADYMLIAPATANMLAKMAAGMADDLLSTIYLATKVPVVVCPAMNKNMWNHPANQDCCKVLASRGVTIAGPGEGSQACGDEGYGRMLDHSEIINVLRLCELNGSLEGHHVVITAGPTREAIDPVRYLTNRSSGKMGYALARAAVMAGAKVSLISGPSQETAPLGVDFVSVQSGKEMQEAVENKLQKGDVFIGSAAVADYFCPNPPQNKIKKDHDSSLTLKLEKNPDILQAVSRSGKSFYTIGFAAETNDVINYARKKLKEKNLNMIIANEVGQNKAFDQDENQVTLLTQEDTIELPRQHKVRLAGTIIEIIATHLQNCTHKD